MDTYGLIGKTLAHSYSQEFFTRKFQNQHINARYLNFEIPHISQLPQLLLNHPDIKGLNVTIPYKCDVIPLLHSLSPEAQAIGAVNVIQITPQPDHNPPILTGHNTDAFGFLQSITPLITGRQNLKALILGTGGASKAVAYALSQLQIPVTHVSRSPRPQTLTYSLLTQEIIATHHIIVNATPLGTYPHTDQAPPIPYRFLTPEHICHDLVYNPPLTTFMRLSAQRGATVKNGLQMLHSQALKAWQIWQQ